MGAAADAAAPALELPPELPAALAELAGRGAAADSSAAR